MDLLGNLTILCGKDGVGKSTEIEQMLTNRSVILDWHGDYAKKGLPGKKFSMQQAKEFVEYCANPELTDVTIVFEEAENYFNRSKANPFSIERIKINWILSAKGPHHRNLHVIFVYHHLMQIPIQEIIPFYDFFFMYEQNQQDQIAGDMFQGTNIWNAWLYYKTLFNKPEEKIKIDRNGKIELVKPPFIFKRDEVIPKISM